MPRSRSPHVRHSLALLLAAHLAGQGPLHEKIASEVDAAFETPVSLEVRTGTAVRVDVAANPFAIREFLLMPDASGSMWFDYGDGPTSKAARVTGALEQLGYAPCAALAKWTRNGDVFTCTLTLTADRDAITATSLRIDSGELAWAKRLRTAGLLKYPDPSEAERIAGFVRLWSEAKHNFAFFERRPELDWDRVLVEWLPRVQSATTASAYYRELEQCFALLQDGHTEVFGPSDRPTAAPPIALAEVEGRIVVTAQLHASALDDAALRDELAAADLHIGDELLAIDGEPVAKVLKDRIHPFLCASTPQHRSLLACPQLLRGEVGTKVRMTVRTGEQAERDVSLTRGYRSARAPRLTRPNGEVEAGIVYVALDSFGSSKAAEAFEGLLPLLRRSKGLVLDVRNNGGGDTKHGNRVISWLTDKPLPGSNWRTREYRPAFRAWGRPEGWHRGEHSKVLPADDPWLGPVVALTGPSTFSAAEDFLVVLKASGRARLVGEATGGSTGQPLVIEGLPVGGRARICTKWDTFPDGTEFVGVGVLPDVEVHPTIADLVAGRDTVFERGLAEMRAAIAK